MESLILDLVKARLGREHTTALDGYLAARISAALEELEQTGIHIQDNARDVMFVADMVCWQYSNRDKTAAMPDWLKLARRERYLQEHNV